MARGSSIKTGDKFGRLTVIRRASPEEVMSAKKSATKKSYYFCDCACGQEAPKMYRGDHLKAGKICSCGCWRAESAGKLAAARPPGRRAPLPSKTEMGFYEGTNVRRLANLALSQREKADARNSTGHRGIYTKGGRFIAKLMFQGKAHYLGCFATLEEAVAARKEAEEKFFLPIIREAEEANLLTLPPPSDESGD